MGQVSNALYIQNDWPNQNLVYKVVNSYISSEPLELGVLSFFDYENSEFVSKLIDKASNDGKVELWRLKLKKEDILTEELFIRHMKAIECGSPSDLSENYKNLERIYNEVEELLSNPTDYRLPLEKIERGPPKSRSLSFPVDKNGNCTIPGYFCG